MSKQEAKQPGFKDLLLPEPLERAIDSIEIKLSGAKINEMDLSYHSKLAVRALKFGLRALICVATDKNTREKTSRLEDLRVNQQLPTDSELLLEFTRWGYPSNYLHSMEGGSLTGEQALRMSKVTGVLTQPGNRSGQPFAEAFRVNDIVGAELQVTSLSGRWGYDNQSGDLFTDVEPGKPMVEALIGSLKKGDLVIKKLEGKTSTLMAGALVFNWNA